MKISARLALCCLFCFGLVSPALAWEWNYGPPASLEDGYRRVIPVSSCGPAFPNPGYVAIGTQDIGGANPDVLVVHTDVNGAPLWEVTYDVQGLGLVDEGMAIVLVPDLGYVFLSNSWNGAWQPALTFITCKGAVQASLIYPDIVTGRDLWGNDLIRTQTGDPAFGTAPGDLAVAGWSRNALNEDAFLMRTDPTGVLRWNLAYDNQNQDEAWSALAEALPVAPALAGDLVAAGRLVTPFGDQQGLVARVSGNDGVIGALPQCIQHHGQAGSDEAYNSLTHLQTFPFAGQFAFAGTTTDPAWLEDIWVTRGNTCALGLQARIGNPPGVAPTSEHGHDVVEVRVPKFGTPVGSLAIAGDHMPAGVPKGALTVLNLALGPIPGGSWLFGWPAPNVETFYSLAEDPNPWPIPLGYVLSGATLAGVGPDPGDLYLVHDDPAVAAPCETSWNPVRVLLDWPQVDLDPTYRELTLELRVDTPYWQQTTGVQTCP